MIVLVYEAKYEILLLCKLFIGVYYELSLFMKLYILELDFIYYLIYKLIFDTYF